MDFHARFRKHSTPQKTKKGTIRKNRKGEPVYTTYLDFDNSEQKRLYEHMSKVIHPIYTVLATTNFIAYFEQLGKNPFERTKIGNEPVATHFLNRTIDVIARLSENTSQYDMTIGIIDSYNYIVDFFYGEGRDDLKVAIINTNDKSYAEKNFHHIKEYDGETISTISNKQHIPNNLERFF